MVRQIEPEGNRRNAPQGSELKQTKDKKRGSVDPNHQQGLDSSLNHFPGEDVEAYQERIDAWMADFHPRNAYEERLIRHAADISWKMDLAQLNDGAILRQRVLDAIAACEGEDAEALMTAATLASFDPSPAGERRRRHQFALSREFFKAIDSLSGIPRRSREMTKEQVEARLKLIQNVKPKTTEP
jgi:hypothetical protein